MALISEWVEQCGKKVLDNAGIVREAMFQQLRGGRLFQGGIRLFDQMDAGLS
jgi:hypothetical protein